MKISRKLTVVALAMTLVGSSLLLTNCKKDKKTEDPEPTPTPAPVVLTNTQKLTGKNFKMTAYTVNPGIQFGPTGPTITDIYAQFDACEKDDIFTFNTDKSLTVDEGASKCDPADPQTTTGTWVWNTDETILTITQDGTPISLTIITNDGTTLKGSYTDVDGGVTYTYTITFTKQ